MILGLPVSPPKNTMHPSRHVTGRQQDLLLQGLNTQLMGSDWEVLPASPQKNYDFQFNGISPSKALF